MAVLQSIYDLAGAANVLIDILQAFRNPQVTIQSAGADSSAVALNVVETENLTFGLSITDKPVETRSRILDHLTLEPIVLRLDGVISNIDTNLQNLETIAAFAGSAIPNLAGLARTGSEVLTQQGLFDTGDEEIKAKVGQLNEWQTDGEVVSFVGLKIDPNTIRIGDLQFLLGTIEYTNSKDIGDGLGFSITIKEVRQAIVEPLSLRGLIEAEGRDALLNTEAASLVSGILS